MKKEVYENYALLVRKVSNAAGHERAEKCGYDLLMGLAKGDHKDRAGAWEIYLHEVRHDQGHTDELRDGCWIPAVPIKV